MLRPQFSLRTLLIVVALLAIPCGYVVWQAKVVRERAEVLLWIKDMGLVAKTPEGPPTHYHGLNGVYRWWLMIDDSKLRWYRKLIGDHYVVSVLSEAQPEELKNRIQAAFPEANFVESRVDY